MIRVCLHSQSASKKHNQEKSPLLHTSCLIIMNFCYCDNRINKTFVYSCCVNCILCYVHLISSSYVCSVIGFFNLNYPQINEGCKSDHIQWTTCTPNSKVVLKLGIMSTELTCKAVHVGFKLLHHIFTIFLTTFLC